MKITITLKDGGEWEEITVDPSTLAATDSLGEAVQLFPGESIRGRDWNATPLREIVEEGCREEAKS